MKLLLASAGFFTPEIIAKAEELVGKKRSEINVAIINEAYAVEHDNNLRWVLDELNKIKDNFGGNLELINLLALDIDTVEKRINKCDIIFVVGGNTDYLMSVMVKTGFAKLLPKLLKTKVYVGSSAGSMVPGRRVSTGAYEEIYGESDDFHVTRYMELVDFALKPHMNNPLFPNNNSKMLLKVTKNYAGTVYGLADDSAIVVNDEKVQIIGSKSVKIIDGELADISI